MNGVLIFFLLIFFVSIGVWIFQRYKEKDRREKEIVAEQARQSEFARQKLFDFFKSKLECINLENSKFAKHLDYKSGYFSNYHMAYWKNQQSTLFNELKGKSFELIGLSSVEVLSIKTYFDYFNNTVNIRNDFNKEFVNEELKAYYSFFNNIEGRKLDIQQRTAIVTDEDNNIVIAGAGSGKTTTIIGKVQYVIDRYKISTDQILLISFTNKSATTLAERIDIKGIEAKTFHKFGKDVIVEAERKQPSVFEEAQFRPLLTKIFYELIRDNNYLQNVTEYFTNFLKPAKTKFEFDNQGEYIQYIKDQNFRSYKLKEVPVNGKMTFKMEVVKSIEECKIANFLLFNGVNYDYEFPYEHDTATEVYKQYKPDFTVIHNGRKYYIEHFGISRSGDVPNWFTGDGVRSASEKYSDDMKWKRDIHKMNGTVLIESYSYEMSEGILFENLTKKLNAFGIILKPKSPEEIWKIISESAKDEVNSFITLFGTFITLMKSNNYSINDVILKNNQTSDAFFKERNKLFVKIIKPIYDRYESHLIERNEIDFSDMINKATSHIVNGKYNRKFDYIIIDEFQDISIGRYRLIKSIKNKNPNCKLFAVGDDWQSIYRFSGSDIALFKDFESYFGFTVKSKIETTYRFQNPLIKLSSEFLLKNPNQANKNLKGLSSKEATNYKIVYSDSENQNDTFALKQIFDEITSEYQLSRKRHIYILGRYSFDIQRISNEHGIIISICECDSQGNILKRKPYLADGWKSIQKSEKIIISYNYKKDNQDIICEAEFLTAHKAKGLEAEIVILINCNSGKHGFPSELTDDQVLNLLLSESDQFENGEERRLFYVAMTRAKEMVYFLSDRSYKSKFIAELEVESAPSQNLKCPTCKTADVVLRKSGKSKNGNTYKFFGCSNYLYGCDYTKTEWENN